MKEFKIKMLFVSFVITLTFASCLKKEASNIDIDNKTGTIMELQFVQAGGSTINSGIYYFSGGALTYPGKDIADTANYNISLAGPVTLSKDIQVTIGVDATKLLDNYSADSITYELMPDSLYSIISTTATIKAGKRIANMQIIFYPSKIDITKSYMLPIVIKDASGQTISSNFSSIYFHVIGNPLAGAYTREWIRYNNYAGTGTPLYDQSAAVVFSPVNATTASVASGSGPKYLISFTNTNGVLSNFRVKFDAASVTAAAIAIIAGPVILTADPANHNFVFQYNYDNLNNGLRNITDKFTR